MKKLITLQDSELNTLLKMLDSYFIHIQEPPATEPIKLLIYSAGIETFKKLEKKYYKAAENQSKQTQYKITPIEKSFLLIFLYHLNIKTIQPHELATRERLIYKLLY